MERTGSTCKMSVQNMNASAGSSAARLRKPVNLRNGLVDYCRLIAIVGIVWYHAKAPGFLFAYSGLPFFLALLALASQNGLSKRATRLLSTFLIWSGIYALVFVVIAAKTGDDLLSWWRPYMLVSGPSIHLWFLPFAFLVSCVAPMLRGNLALVLPVFVASLMAALGEISEFPWYQWSFGLIPMLAGFAFLKDRCFGLLSLAASVLVLEIFRPSPDSMVIAGGTAMAFLAMSVKLPATVVSDWCARLSIWVYLGHILVMLKFKLLGFEGYSLALATIAGSLVVSVGIEVVLSRHPPGTSQGCGRPTP